MLKIKKVDYKKSLVLLIFIAILLLFFVFDVYSYIGLDRVLELKNWILSFGFIGPVIYIIIYWASCLFFLPGFPVTILGAIIFGPVVGTILISIGSTTGATLSFLFARYLGRAFIEERLGQSSMFKKIDEGVKEQGTRMLMITRLVPLFPFNVQNYVYGLTKISLVTFIFVSWICMLPGTIAYAFLAGGLIDGEGEIGKTLTYLGIGAIFLVIVSFVPKMIEKRQKL